MCDISADVSSQRVYRGRKHTLAFKKKKIVAIITWPVRTTAYHGTIKNNKTYLQQ